MNCWQLCCLVLERELGLVLPRYEQIDPMDWRAVADEMNSAPLGLGFGAAEQPRFGDVLLFHPAPPWPPHAALAVDDCRMLHVREGALSEIAWYDDSWRGRLWRPRLAGAFRHKSLTFQDANLK